MPTCPSRRTTDLRAAICRSARKACSARYSCTNPMIAFRTTIARIAAASSGSPIAPETAAAAMRSRIMKSVNCAPRIRQGPRGAASPISLRPWRTRRRAASSEVRPDAAVVSSRRAACATESACQAGSGTGSREGAGVGMVKRGRDAAGRRRARSLPFARTSNLCRG